ncbi:discoidin domain-containing protein [Agromyces tropicus]|uniref:Discoidin domain-containing protein n=1 Tax=Agromyces tropicus TaxID=555371 RepID=A0ABN2UEH3_9MICO
MSTNAPPTPRTRMRTAAAVIGAILVAGAVAAGPAQAAPPQEVDALHPDFGPNVTIFDPSMPLADIDAELDALADQQRDAEMSEVRRAVYFMPGAYGDGEHPLQFEVGYYTEVAGLGASPSDVTVEGAIEVYNRCLGSGDDPNCIALVNFWRTLSNLSLHVNGASQDGCRASANFWAVSQAVSMRRLDISGANLSLMDYCTDGPQYASGGFIADSRLPFTINGSQQQWLTRNSDVSAGWSNAVWNQVFAGTVGAPDDAAFPDPPYTTLDTTPVSREKPYLFVDDEGAFNVRVPSAATDTRGVSWAEGMTPGRTVPIGDFYLAKPGDSVQRINQALASGKNLLLTPGIYDIDATIKVKRADTVVLGMGHATLTATGGAVPMEVADVPGVVVAGVTFDAGTELSPALLRVGKPNGDHGANARAAASDPITLNDVYVRVGGPHVGRVDTAIEVNADHVLIDHAWVWRGDHGVEGFTEGVNGDTDRWNTNTGRNGIVVNGDHVTATGLFVEHFQRFNTLWNGDDGTVVLYQNELPYDPPTQADWTQPDGTLGYPGYVVADDVDTHALHGAGVYVFNQNAPSIVTENGFSVPEREGVRLHHVMTVNLSAGTILHVVNGTGEAADMDHIGAPRFIVDYPAP